MWSAQRLASLDSSSSGSCVVYKLFCLFAGVVVGSLFKILKMRVKKPTTVELLIISQTESSLNTVIVRQMLHKMQKFVVAKNRIENRVS